MSTCIALGPNNAYFVNAPKRWAFNNLPESVMELLTQKPQIRDVREMALGPNGSYLVVYIANDGSERIRHGNLPTGLVGWLFKNGSSIRDHATLQCSLGPNGAYFAFDDNGSIRGGLPTGMENSCKQRLLSNGNWKPGTYPASATFGPDGQFVVTTTGGGGYWNLSGTKGELNTTLRDLKSLKGILVVLSPFNGDHWVLVNYNGIGEVNGAVEDEAVTNFNNFEADLRELLRNERAKIQSHTSRNSKSRSISKGINVGFKLLNAVLNGANDNSGSGSVNYTSTTNDFNSGGSDFWTPLQSAASDSIQ